MGKRVKENRGLGFVEFTCNEVHDHANRLYEASFTDEGEFKGVGEHLNETLFDLRNYIDDTLDQINND